MSRVITSPVNLWGTMLGAGGEDQEAFKRPGWPTRVRKPFAPLKVSVSQRRILEQRVAMVQAAPARRVLPFASCTRVCRAVPPLSLRGILSAARCIEAPEPRAAQTFGPASEGSAP